MIESEDCKYCFTAGKFKDCYDCIHNGGGLEIGYETFAAIGYNLLFTRDGAPCSNLICCSECNSVSDCFGCVGLHNKEQYYIFNKKYSKDQYEILVGKIIEHMEKTGEWGEYFPISMSPFGYNETTAHDFYPVTKDYALSQKWQWHEDTEIKPTKTSSQIKEIPANIKDVPDSITNEILICNVSKKPYKIIPQELKFYREHNLPIPLKCPDQRHKERVALRSPRKLWNRECAKCKKPISTTYAPERPETVYCEQCFLKEVY